MPSSRMERASSIMFARHGFRTKEKMGNAFKIMLRLIVLIPSFAMIRNLRQGSEGVLDCMLEAHLPEGSIYTLTSLRNIQAPTLSILQKVTTVKP